MNAQMQSEQEFIEAQTRVFKPYDGEGQLPCGGERPRSPSSTFQAYKPPVIECSRIRIAA